MNKKRKLPPLSVLPILLVFLCPLLTGLISAPEIRAAANPSFPEGRDFATQVMRSPWTMSDYAEISQYINHSGQVIYLQNITMQDGVFSARSAGTDAQFYPLFPGYWTAMLIGKVGHNYPIASRTYKVLYIAMKVNSGPANPSPDQFQVMWFGDERQNAAGGVWGYSKGIPLYPEAGSKTPTPTWKLYKVDLSSPQTYWGKPPGPTTPPGRGCASIPPFKPMWTSR